MDQRGKEYRMTMDSKLYYSNYSAACWAASMQNTKTEEQ
jgi:hypothetical protein